MLNILTLGVNWFDRDQRASVGGGVLVLVIHVIVMGSVFRDMAQSGVIV